MKFLRHFWLPFYIAAIVDLGLTLLAQPAEYWRDFSKVNEASPHAALALQIHPLVYIAGAILYLYFLPKILNRFSVGLGCPIFFALFLGHVWGGTGWIWQAMKRLGVYSSASNRLDITVAWTIAALYLLFIGYLLSRALIRTKEK